jgi:adenylate kinase family enzyme
VRRVLVIGCGGAGKSTLARRIAMRTDLPLFHLDALYWRPGWKAASREEWDGVLAQLMGRPEWVMDGNYGRTIPERLRACDTVVFLDRPRYVCLWNLVRRRLQYAGRSRPDLAAGCPEQLTWEFIWWVLMYRRRRRPEVLRQLAELEAGKRVVILRDAASIERFVASLCTDTSDRAGSDTPVHADDRDSQ